MGRTVGEQGSCGQNDHPHRPLPHSGPQSVLPLTKGAGRNASRGGGGQPAGRPRPETGRGQGRALGTPVITLPASVWAQTGLPTRQLQPCPSPRLHPGPFPRQLSSARCQASESSGATGSRPCCAFLRCCRGVSTGASLTNCLPAGAARNSPFWLLCKEAAGGGQGLWIR